MSGTKNNVQTWHFTFGCGHVLRKHEQPIRAESAMDARLKMLDLYGRHWAEQHSTDRWPDIEMRYGPYTSLPTVEVTPWEAKKIAARLGLGA